jgi:hypothetical protein
MTNETFIDINQRFAQLIDERNYRNGLSWEIDVDLQTSPKECYKVFNTFISDIKVDIEEDNENWKTLLEDLYDDFLDFTKKMGFSQIWFQHLNFDPTMNPVEKNKAYLVIVFRTIGFSLN